MKVAFQENCAIVQFKGHKAYCLYAIKCTFRLTECFISFVTFYTIRTVGSLYSVTSTYALPIFYTQAIAFIVIYLCYPKYTEKCIETLSPVNNLSVL